MKTVITVLNERKDAKRRWPAEGALCYVLGPAQTEHCCLGAHGLAYGIPVDDMTDKGMPHNATWSELQEEWAHTWDKVLPSEVFAAVYEAWARKKMGYDGNVPDDDIQDIPFGRTAGDIAAAINDSFAVRHNRGHARKRAVAALRILFRWVGEQQGERWIIRHIK